MDVQFAMQKKEKSLPKITDLKVVRFGVWVLKMLKFLSAVAWQLRIAGQLRDHSAICSI
jgi:hypothetical protein